MRRFCHLALLHQMRSTRTSTAHVVHPRRSFTNSTLRLPSRGHTLNGLEMVESERPIATYLPNPEEVMNQVLGKEGRRGGGGEERQKFDFRSTRPFRLKRMPRRGRGLVTSKPTRFRSPPATVAYSVPRRPSAPNPGKATHGLD